MDGKTGKALAALVVGGAVLYFVSKRAVAGPGTPGAPTDITAVPGDGQATVSWSAPASDGGSPITGYEVYTSQGGPMVQVPAGTLTAVVTGLTNGQTRTFKVAAVNSAGIGARSVDSNPVTPTAGPVITVPSAPQNVQATAGDGQALITWQLPADDGGVPVDRYRIRVTEDGITESSGVLSPQGLSTSVTMIGLVNGHSYAFEVRAGNAEGVGPWSAMSNTVVPQGVAPPSASKVMLLATGNSQKNTLLRDLTGLWRPGDTFIAQSSLDNINAWCAEAKAVIPGVRCMALVSGLAAVQATVAGAAPEVDGIIYNYTPNANSPEFSVVPATALANFQQFAALLGGRQGAVLISALALEAGWNWSQVLSTVPEPILQLQSYCKAGTFPPTVDALEAAMGAGAWRFSISVDPAKANGVAPDAALSCFGYAAARGNNEAMIEWAVPGLAQLQAFMTGLAR